MESSSQSSSVSLFGGCTRLGSQYREIGIALLCYEAQVGTVRSVIAMGKPNAGGALEQSESYQTFARAVSFVPVEVLESYLEDLLNYTIPESRLAIADTHSPLRATLITLGGMIFAVGLGGYASWIGAGLALALSITIFMAVPFAIHWYFLPKESFVRRLVFGHVLTHEIGRRRGSSGMMRAVGC